MCHLSKETWTRLFNLGPAVKREMATSPVIRSVQIDQLASSLSISGESARCLSGVCQPAMIETALARPGRPNGRQDTSIT